MMLRKLILCVVLLTSAFVQHAAFSSAASHDVHGLRIDRALVRAFAGKAAPATSGFDSNYKLSLPKPVQDKNFYLLSLFQRKPQARKLLSQNKALKQLAADKASALKKAASCNNVGCFDDLIRFDGPTIEAVAAELQKLANGAEFKLLANKDLRPSGVFIKYSAQPDAQMLVAAWKDAAA